MERVIKRLLAGVALGAALLGGGTFMLAAAEPAATQPAAKALSVIDFSELQLDGAAALVLTFNTPLDDKQDFAARVALIDDKSGKVDGGWELAPFRPHASWLNTILRQGRDYAQPKSNRDQTEKNNCV